MPMIAGISGASGFIGSALAERLVAEGHTLRCLTRRPHVRGVRGAQVVEGDLTKPDDRLARFADGLDVLYHCAGEMTDELRMTSVNVGGTQALVEAARGRIGRWVQLSSAGVYGRHHMGVVTEATPVDPQGTYEMTKARADVLVMEARARGEIASCAVLRPSIVFGDGMRNQSIAQLVRIIDRGVFFYIGAPGASANYVHVSDVVDALVLCARAPEADGRVYNLSDWCTVEEFAGAIADALGRARPRARLPERPVRRAVRLLGRVTTLPLTESRIDALVTRGRYSIERLQQELKYRLSVPIAAGLARMIERRSAA